MRSSRLTPPSRRRCLLILASVSVAALTVPALAVGAGDARVQRAPARLQVIPVWAYVNGANPVVGGRVLITSDGKPVLQIGARKPRLTNVNGVALIGVRRIPHRFTVIVRGGRVAGRRLTGSLRSLRARARGPAVVEVNPLTALVTQLRVQRPGLRFGQASRLVKRYFRVPWWADLGQNLRDGPRWFSARTYVRQVRRVGSIDRLNRAVARRILRGGPRFPRISRTAGTGSTGPGIARAAGTGSTGPAPALHPASETAVAAGLTAGQRVVAVFKHLRDTAIGIGSQQLVGGVLGALLQVGSKALGIKLPKSDLEQVKAQLSALSTQITELKGELATLSTSVARNQASAQLNRSSELTSDISFATSSLQTLASANANGELRTKLAEDTIAHIRKLLPAPERFEDLLNPSFDIADNPIKAVSHALASSRFFDARQSNEVRAVYDYYASYQAELAVALTNYWNTDLTSFPAAYQKGRIARLETTVTNSERSSLKPTVPAGAFIDTRTPKFMWATHNQTVNARTLLDEKLQTRNTLRLGSWGNYQLPSAPDLSNLLDGWTGNPRSWLQSQIEVSLAHQLWWVSNSVTTQRVGIKSGTCNVRVTVFDLATGKLEQHGYGNSPFSERVPGCRLNDPAPARFLESKSGGLLLLRYLAPGESYYW